MSHYSVFNDNTDFSKYYTQEIEKERQRKQGEVVEEEPSTIQLSSLYGYWAHFFSFKDIDAVWRQMILYVLLLEGSLKLLLCMLGR